LLNIVPKFCKQIHFQSLKLSLQYSFLYLSRVCTKELSSVFQAFSKLISSEVCKMKVF
jgi:hypothetical protein